MGTFVVAALLAAGLAVSGTAAGAEAMSRDQYVPQLEEICKPGAEATRRAMEGVRDDVRDPDRIPVAARKFARASRIFGSTIAEIARVQRPAADVSRLKEWFLYLNRQEDYLVQIAAQLRHEHTIKAQRLTARFIHNGNLANNVTLAFGFYYCSFKFSRYG
jgi:hypothetical protein